jgi:hypothetical protein
MHATHLDAEKRYGYIREQALLAAMELLQESGTNDITLKHIDHLALDESKKWARSISRRKDWDWGEGYHAIRFRYPKRFEMAIWHCNNLIGLSMGRPTYYGTALRLDVVEAAPADMVSRPGIMEYILLGYSIYARLINAREVRIMNPVNSQVLDYYKSFGYTYVEHGDYLFRSLD